MILLIFWSKIDEHLPQKYQKYVTIVAPNAFFVFSEKRFQIHRFLPNFHGFLVTWEPGNLGFWDPGGLGRLGTRDPGGLGSLGTWDPGDLGSQDAWEPGILRAWGTWEPGILGPWGGWGVETNCSQVQQT